MTKIEKLILALVGATILTIFGIGATNSFAEEIEYFEDVIRIPIPDNVIGQDKKSKLTEMTDNILEFTVTYRFYTDGNFTYWKEQILLGGAGGIPDVTLCPDRFYLDEDGETCYPIITDPLATDTRNPPEEFDRFIADLERFKENPPKKPSEIDYYEQLKFLQMCYRQSETNQQSLGVTDTDGFAVSNLWIEEFGHLLKSYQVTGNMAALNKHIEECFAIHTQLNPLILGAEYQNRAKYFNSTQVYHGDLASDVPVWSQDRVNQEANMGIDTTKNYCDEVQHLGLETKRYLGCDGRTESNYGPSNIGQGKKIYPDDFVYRPNQDYGEYVFDNIPLTDYSAWQKWQQFKIDDGAEMYKQLKRDAISEKIRQLLQGN